MPEEKGFAPSFDKASAAAWRTSASSSLGVVASDLVALSSRIAASARVALRRTPASLSLSLSVSGASARESPSSPSARAALWRTIESLYVRSAINCGTARGSPMIPSTPANMGFVTLSPNIMALMESAGSRLFITATDAPETIEYVFWRPTMRGILARAPAGSLANEAASERTRMFSWLAAACSATTDSASPMAPSARMVR